MGIMGKDIDDGLALLYLLGRLDVELEGVTTTYGNGSIEEVNVSTEKLLKDMGISDVPLVKGAGSKRNRISPAARFLARKASEASNTLTVLGTGSLSNLYGAYLYDNSFFSNVREFVLMGGITEPLIINGKNLDELNFSVHPEAAYAVLSSGAKVTILTGNFCLQALFNKRQQKIFLSKPIYAYVEHYITEWNRFFSDEFGTDGFFLWDMVAAVYSTSPSFFESSTEIIISKEDDLHSGFLNIQRSEGETVSPGGFALNIPQMIKNPGEFWKTMFDSWGRITYPI
jgi:inosine-uridine nucleoside N-ribohydrolase